MALSDKLYIYIYHLLCIINRNTDFIELAQKTVKWQALANMVINFWIREIPRNFLTGWAVATC